MKRRVLLPCVLLLGLTCLHADERVMHEMTVRLDPATHRLRVESKIELPREWLSDQDAGVEFLLNAALEIVAGQPEIEPLGAAEGTTALTLNGRTIERGPQADLRRYRVVPGADGRFELAYDGVFDFGLSDQSEEYTRGFRETSGMVGDQGVFLAADGVWYPYFGDDLVEFELRIEGLPDGWHVISEGRGTSRDDEARARWSSEGPVDEIHLTGGPLAIYREQAGATEALVYLHERDDALAEKYLTATAQYLEMYRELVGAYPYSKFALVENYWETGYGMPSFTLLGPRVIRFPFILTSSYPHEILHNWWGNGVFVDYASGNWSEGLTAYMADYLIQEQRGRGRNYRRDTLQKYRNYVKQERDFPLEEFRSRHSAATEAVGYGKSLMLFHMLRRELGDDVFRSALAGFYRQNRGKQASFRDLQRSFEKAGGVELASYFDQWLTRAGAPALEVSVGQVLRDGEQWVLRGELRQTQRGEPFAARVPVVVDTRGDRQVETIEMAGRSTSFDLRTADEPVLLRVDPRFDLFRLLDPRESPPSIGQLFGEPEILALLPSAADPREIERYTELMQGWQSDNHSIEIRPDSEVDTLPGDRAVWILGRENRFVERLFTDVTGLEISAERIAMEGEGVAPDDHSWVAIRRHTHDPEKAIGWLVVEMPAAFAGMGRKLPHYGKYSYLAFEGDAPDNVVKGQWPASDSPLSVDLRPEAQRERPMETAAFVPRPALAELPPVFSERALAEHVRFLAADEMEGRGIGTAGLDRAASYVAERFADAGLTPGGDHGYLQSFTVPEGPDGGTHRVSNVIGYIPGAREEWKDQLVILCAHYDHLGHGWPDVYKGNEGRVHPGADDNASGVAVLLELAKSFAEGDPPPRTLVFAAFTGEEAGRLGSRHFLEQPGGFSRDGIRAVINMDTVGRLLDGKISVLGTGTADEWQHIFRGVSFVTGVESRNVAESSEASDQMSFIDAGIPAVQIFTLAHEDYHRPGDTADKVDAAGLVKVATFVKESTVYLVQREERLTVTIAGAGESDSGRAARPSGGRKVSFGTVPEFGFAGPGVQIASLIPGSPAEQAGLQAGDILIRLDESEIADLRGFSDLLKTLEAGQTVVATFVRDGEELEAPVTVVAR